MALFSSIYKTLASQPNVGKNYSPPPEIDQIVKKKHKTREFLYSHVKARVDCSAPRWSPKPLTNALAKWQRLSRRNYLNNLQLVANLRKTSFEGGKVDCRKRYPLYHNKTYTNNRNNFYRKINGDNRLICKLLKESQCKVIPTKILERQWKDNKRRIVDNASTKFVLFPITPKEDVEDSSYLAPPGVKRPRVTLTLRLRGGAELGSLTVELFTDVAPRTCRLFTELLDGDGRGHGYVGTQFFRKIPHLYWSGGDVIHDNGFGCYAQRGRRKPIPAENYHLPHSMPGLLSMRVTADDEVCGVFTITFKPLPQLDLKNVVFGRVVRPSCTFDAMRSLGSALSTHPQVEIAATRRKSDGVWIHGTPNTKIHKRTM